jgi:type IV pilus assembly protein PilO
MATKAAPINVDLNSVFEGAASQFRGLNPNEPGQWPLLPKLAVWALVAVAVVVLGWFTVLATAHDELDAERAKEPGLKQDYRAKLAQAVNLAELRKQKLQVEGYVTQLEKQLPGKAEMDALLSDINQAGLGRGLQFELFRPGQVVVKDYYAELPIAIRVSGRYHDIGAFAADIANLSRIVTLHNLNITAVPGNASGGAVDGSDGADLPLPRHHGGRGDEEQDGQGQAGGEEMRATPVPSRSLLALGVVAFALTACSGDQQELTQWMEQQRREVKPSVQPLSPPKKFEPQPYAMLGGVEPFSSQKLTVALKQEAKQPNSLLSAELNRRKEPLEAYPLDSMSMVGSVVRGGRPYALLRVDNLLYQVKTGDYLGQNYGKITKISETDISLREIVQDAAGEWIERTSALQLQEKAR